MDAIQFLEGGTIIAVESSLSSLGTLVVSSIRLESGLVVQFSPPATASVSVQLAELDDEQ
ncbi:hypothetical protein PCI56_05430 [Plesiomonas shigelloides subsp. oncorhynchi]|uniref:hypothetical protein n=1 Tax=Gammaproteobacteria TaxID=1236 RepID=UPI001077FAA7|nr:MULTISPECIES: hypothetical protein [Gammaproteobacteria]EAB9607392.1 hypothetical protein [Salmonella enterica subsp. enterica serovar Infantis]ECU8224824.1 hypothetical protein [Salmonella enterica subsp. enterica serovar Thompson]MDA1379398.1 hypothetical protein [Plesiomonas shigelloides]EFB1672084.1 hypothetical protein [Escherichia coli]EFF6323006.1 hypothetical protein [Escherichia coli]